MTDYRSVTRLRKTLFWVFAAVFLLTWPPLLFYTLGVAPARGSDELLTETGAIRVESLPADAAVVFDGRRLEERTPTVLDRIEPGSHTLRLEKEDHESWSGTIQIEPRTVVRITPAVLPRKVRSDPELLSRLPLRDVVMAAEGQYIGLVADRVGQFSVINAEEESVVSLSGELVAFSNHRVRNVAANRNGSRFYLWTAGDDERRLLVTEAGNQSGTLEVSTANPHLMAADLLFEPPLSGDVIVFRDNRLLRLKSWTDGGPEELSRGGVGAAVFQNALFYLEKNGTVGQVTAVGRHKELFELPGAAVARLGGESRIRLVHGTDNWIGYVTEQGLTISTKNNVHHYSDIVGAYPDPNRERLIVWSTRRFGVVRYPDAQRDQSGSAGVVWMGSGHSSDAIVDTVYSVADGTHVMYARDGAVWIQPVIPKVEAEPTEVLRIQPDMDFWFSEASGKLIWARGNEVVMEKVVADQPLITLE